MFNNIMTITDQNAQSSCTFQSFLKKVQFCLQTAETWSTVNEMLIVRPVYKKPSQEIYTTAGQTQGNYFPVPSTSDLLEVQYLHLT